MRNWKEYNILITLKNFLRLEDWFDSKLPTVIFTYALISCAQSTPFLLSELFGLIVLFISLLSFGHILNDWSDIEIDKRAGKIRPIQKLDNSLKILTTTLSILFGVFGLFLVKKFNADFILLVLVGYFLAIAYSIKPFRFKERGIYGLFVSDFAQRTLPALWPFAINSFYPNYFWLLIFLWTALGLRWNLVHQFEDYQSDKKSDVQTFVVIHGKRNSLFLLNLLFYLEILFFVLICNVLLNYTNYLAFVWILLFLLDLFTFSQKPEVNIFYTKTPKFENSPLSFFYAIYWPLATLIFLPIARAYLLILVMIFIAMTFRHILWSLKEQYWILIDIKKNIIKRFEQ